MISSPPSAMNCSTGVVCGIGVFPAVPPPATGAFCLMFCAPESIVSRALTPVARCMIVTSARKGSRRYFQFARGRWSSWFAVSAVLQLKSGIDVSVVKDCCGVGMLAWSAPWGLLEQRAAVRARAEPVPALRGAVAVDRHAGELQSQQFDFSHSPPPDLGRAHRRRSH